MKFTVSILLVGFIFLLIVMSVTACFKLEKNHFMNKDISAKIKDDAMEIYVERDLVGLELIFYGQFDESMIKTNNNYLLIVKNEHSKTIVALTKKNSDEMKKGEKVLEITNKKEYLENIDIATRSMSDISDKELLKPASVNEGISFIGEISYDSTTSLFLHCKGLASVDGIETRFTYDNAYVNIIDVKNLRKDSLSIITRDATNGIVNLAVAFFNRVDLNDDDIFLITVKGLKEGNTDLSFQDYSKAVTYNSEIGCLFNTKTFEVAPSNPLLLGDFNQDNEVSLVDFILFARHYNSKVGDEKYSLVYDIEPAEDCFADAWNNLYDTNYPDGDVDISDFIVFAHNYNSIKPSSTSIGGVHK